MTSIILFANKYFINYPNTHVDFYGYDSGTESVPFFLRLSNTCSDFAEL